MSGGSVRYSPSASLAPPTPPDSANTGPPVLIAGVGSSEKIVLGRADQRGGGRVGRGPSETPHQDDRRPFVGLALDQRGGGGDLVGESGLGDFELAAEQIGVA